MKKRLRMSILLGYALAAHGAHAETGLNLLWQDKEIRTSALSRASSPNVRSHIALIFDAQSQLPLYNKNSRTVAPIASITKLMTAMVMLDAMLPLHEEVTIEAADLDRLKGTRSRLQVGMTFTLNDLLRLALMASENRAASALARSYPGGKAALVAAMNAKANELGMLDTRFIDPAGLSRGNVSTAQDLVKLVAAARDYDLIRQYTTSASHSVDGSGGRELRFTNTNPLVRSVSWDIGLSKTGYISEAGLCLVMEANVNQRPVIIVLLNSWGKRTRVGDANRIKRWMESGYARGRSTRQG